MKLLENVMMYDHEGVCHSFRFEAEGENYYAGCSSRKYINKLTTRPLTLDEQLEYLYDLCCRPDSRLGDYFGLNEFMGGRLANLLPETMLHPDESRETFIKQDIRYFLVQPERKTKIIDTSNREMKP